MNSIVPESETPGARSLEPWRSLAILAAWAALSFARSGPPSPQPEDAPADQFSAARAGAVLARILGAPAAAEPHPVGTAAHERVRERLVAELARLGLTAEVQEAFAAGPHSNVARVRNVMARIPGRESRPAVLFTAHYDSVAAGPGAGDDGAGVAALIEIARALASGPTLRRDVILLFTDGEELGLIGARAFSREHAWAEDVTVVVNLEGRGTCGPSEMFETGEDNAAWMALFERAVERPAASSLAYEVYKRMPNDTDMTVFKRAGRAGFNFAFIGGLRRYHTPLDDLAHLDRGSLQHHGDNGLALGRVLAEADLPRRSEAPSRPASASRVVYTDVLGFTLLAWPETLSLAIALAELAACAALGFSICRSGSCRWSAIGRGLLLGLGLAGAAVLFGFASQRALVALGSHPEPWVGRLPWMASCLGAGVVCTTSLVLALPSARRVGVLGAWIGGWTLFTLLGVAVALVAPGASPLFALPGAVAAAVCLLGAWRPALFPARLERGLAWLPLSAVALTWIPLAIGLGRALEFQAAALDAGVIGVLLAGAAPGWLAAPRRRVLRLGTIAGLGAAALGAALVLTAPGTAEEPAHLNFAHVIDADRREEHWLAASFGWPLPAAVRAAGAFENTIVNPYPGWSYAAKIHASAPRVSAVPPDDRAPLCRLSSSDAQPLGGSGGTSPMRELHVSIRSQRGARALLVRAGSGVELRSVALKGREIRLEERSTLAIVGADDEEIDLVIAVAGGARAELELADSMRLSPEEAPALFDARPARFVPRGEGDVSIVVRRFALDR